MLRHPLILLAFVDVTVGIVFFEGFYVSAKGRVTCFDRPDHSAIVSIVYRVPFSRVHKGVETAARQRVNEDGSFELEGNVTLNFPMSPNYQLKVYYGCTMDDGPAPELVDIPRDYVTVVKKPLQHPKAEKNFVHNFNYDDRRSAN